MWYQEPPGLEATGRAAPKPPPEFSARRRGVLHRAKEGRWQTKLLQKYSWSASSNGESTPSSDFPGTVSTASWKPWANPWTGFARTRRRMIWSGSWVGNEGPPQSAVGTQQAPAIEYVGGTGRAPEGSGIRVVVVLSALFIVLLAGGAVVANAVLSSIYSPEHTMQNYFAAQSHGDALGIYSRATYLRGGS